MRLSFGDFMLDCDQRVLWLGADIVPLSPKVFDTLRLLVLSEGRIVTKQDFMEALWPDSFVEQGNLSQNIFVLRKVLGSTSDGRSYIETVPKRGYRFVGTVRAEAPILPSEPRQAVLAPMEDTAPPETGTGDIHRDTNKVAEAGWEQPASNGLLPDHEAPPATRPSSEDWTWIAAFVVIVLVLLALGFYNPSRFRTDMRVVGYVRLTNDGRLKDLQRTPAPIVPVGSEIELTEADGKQSVVARVPLQGGEISYAAPPSPSAHLIGLQPDSRTLLFGSEWEKGRQHPLLSLDLLTGRSAPVLDIDAQEASWSPDGSRLAYAQVGRVFVRAIGGSTHLIAAVQGQAYWIRWSPNGRVLRFTETYDGYHDRLWEVSREGGDLHLWLPEQRDSDHACCGSWTKSGKAFVYLSVQPDNNRIRIRPEHTELWDWWSQIPIDIAAAPLDKWSAPVPSADSKHIFAIGEQLRGQLFSIDPATHQPKSFLPGLSAEGVNFSADGKQIAWTAYPEGTLWRSQSDGSGRVQLTKAPLLARFPHWSPDGASIAFTAARPGSNWQVYRLSPHGSEVTPLVREANGQGVPTWSPDGKQIAFGHTFNETSKTPPFIEVFHLGDRHASRIPGSEGLWTPRWSPNGRFLSAVTADNRTLRLYEFATKQWMDLAHVSVNDVVWSPDSESLFFDCDSSVKPALYRFDLKDKRLEIWASLENVRRAGFFAPWVGISPEGSPIVLGDASIQELYSIAVNLP